MELRRTQLLERYELGQVLGSGNIGVVYQAHDRLLNRQVALKTILQVDAAAMARLYQEWYLLSMMAHPNVINIYDIGEFDHEGTKKPFCAMPLLRGVTLDRMIREGSPSLTVTRVLDLIAQACRGLDAAHQQGVGHRNIKPGNIFVLDDNSVKLLDFGIAAGLSPYTAPELLDPQQPTPLSDLFALGVVTHYALTRQLPFQGTTEAELIEAIRYHPPHMASALNPEVSSAVSQVVSKSLAKRPASRFVNVAAFGEALQRALRNELEPDQTSAAPIVMPAAPATQPLPTSEETLVSPPPDPPPAEMAVSNPAPPTLQEQPPVPAPIPRVATTVKTPAPAYEPRIDPQPVPPTARALRNPPAAAAPPTTVVPEPVPTPAPTPIRRKGPVPIAFRKMLYGVIAALSVLLVMAGTAYLTRPRAVPAASPPVEYKVSLLASVLGADITLNGKPCGTSTCTVTVGSGKYRAEAQFAGYLPAVETFTVSPEKGAPAAVGLNLVPAPSLLTISTDLQGAALVVDGDPAAQLANGSAAVPRLTPGIHEVSIHGGGLQGSLSLEIANGAAPRLAHPIQARGMRVFVLAELGTEGRLYGNQPGITVTLDGRLIGDLASQGIDLAGLVPGAHELTLEGPPGHSDRLVFESKGPAAVYAKMSVVRGAKP